MPDGTIRRNAKADVTKTVAWRERRLIFDDAPLTTGHRVRSSALPWGAPPREARR
jgi:hypothetical protein